MMQRKVSSAGIGKHENGTPCWCIRHRNRALPRKFFVELGESPLFAFLEYTCLDRAILIYLFFVPEREDIS